MSSSSSAFSAASVRYRPMLLIFAALACGVWGDDAWAPPAAVWLLLAAGGGLTWLMLWLRRAKLATAPLLLLVAAAGGLRHQASLASLSVNDLGASVPSAPAPLVLEATALTGARIAPPAELTPFSPRARRSQTRLLVRVDRVRDGQSWRPASGKGWLTIEGERSEIGAGDRLHILGEYSRVAISRGNPGELDRKRYARIDGVGFYLRCKSPDQVEIIAKGSALSPARWIGFQRQRWIAKLHERLGERQGSLAAAILLGAREQLDRPRIDSFLLTGVSHVLVVSGANVAILAGSLLWLQRVVGLPRTVAFGGIAFAIVWFALLADADAPVLRAAAAMLVLLLARYWSRRVDSVQAWSAAGAVVLLWNPAYLFSLGAQLSFLSVATLIEAAATARSPLRMRDPLERLLFRSRPWPMRFAVRLTEVLWESLRTSFWVWLATAPLIWTIFGAVQWGPLLLNPLLALPFAAALNCGMLLLALDDVIPGAGPLLGTFCGGLLHWMEGMTAAFASRGGMTLPLPPPAATWTAVFYLGLLAVAAFSGWGSQLGPLGTPPDDKSLRRRGATLLGLGLTWFAISAGWSLAQGETNGNAQLKLTFLNVGHGTSVLIETPDGETWLYDAGNRGDGHDAARIVWEALQASHKIKIDRVIVSHDDTDHYSALPQLLPRVRIGEICWTRDFEPPQSAAARILVARAPRFGVATRRIDDSTRWERNGFAIRVLHPSADEWFGSDNSRSVVLEIEYAGRRILLPGDLETPGLELVLSRPSQPYDVVMAPHHGSERSAPQRFAGWARPQHVVISGGEEDRRDATIEAYIAGGAEVHHTAEVGAVIVEISATGGMTVRRGRTTAANDGIRKTP